MKILIINLDGEQERLKFQQQQMSGLGLKFQRLRAIEAKDLPAETIATQAQQWERPMRPSEVACLASHKTAWELAIRDNKPVLVLEDDALLSHKTPALLASLEKTPGLEHVTLEIRGRKKILAGTSLDIDKGLSLTRLYQDRTGAAAYIIWPEGAKKLLARSNRAAGLADAIIAAAYELSSWQVEPAAAMQLDQCEYYGVLGTIKTRTTIGTAAHRKPDPENKLMALRFKARRIASQLRMGLRRLSTRYKAKRRFVTVEIADFQTHIPPSKNKPTEH